MALEFCCGLIEESCDVLVHEWPLLELSSDFIAEKNHPKITTVVKHFHEI